MSLVLLEIDVFDRIAKQHGEDIGQSLIVRCESGWDQHAGVKPLRRVEWKRRHLSMVFKTVAGFYDKICGRLLNRQPWMSRHVRIFCLLVLSQAACLALGLWLESRFVGSLTRTMSDGVSNALPAGEGALSAERSAVRPDGQRAVDYSATAMKTMAFFWIAALQAVVAYLVLSRVRTEASRKKMAATSESLKRQNDLVRTRDAVIFGLAKLAESRDPETGNHLERIVLYSTRLVAALLRYSRYQRQINSTFVKLIGISSALHDIGKVGVKDSVLLKPGKLEKKERELMESHTEIGGKCIEDIGLRLGSSNFLKMAREIALFHHERWDGTGYPKKLAGEDIPLAARIVAVCDVYDALAIQRTYKDSFSHEKCVKIIREGAGSHFDPTIVDVFLEIQSEFRDIALRCADPVDRPEADVDDCAVEAPETSAPAADIDAIPAILTDSLPDPSLGLSIDLDLLTRDASRQRFQPIEEFPCPTRQESSSSF